VNLQIPSVVSRYLEGDRVRFEEEGFRVGQDTFRPVPVFAGIDARGHAPGRARLSNNLYN
jgi:hypothetical protein